MDSSFLPAQAAWLLAGLVALLVLDRLLLAAERRSWIYYRKGGFHRGGSMYHINELSEMLGGGGVPRIEEEVEEEDPGELFLGPRP